MEMKDILNRMLNHEELSREETRDIIVGCFLRYGNTLTLLQW